MKNFAQENWFKIAVVLLMVVFIIVYSNQKNEVAETSSATLIATTTLATTIKKVTNEQVPEPAPKKVYVAPAPVVKQCRPEIKITVAPPYEIFEIEEYLENVIDSNASLDDLRQIREFLVEYRENAIDNNCSMDASESEMRYGPDDLRAIEGSYSELCDTAIKVYENYIQTTDQIIRDKMDDGCIDMTY